MTVGKEPTGGIEEMISEKEQMKLPIERWERERQGKRKELREREWEGRYRIAWKIEGGNSRTDMST